MGEPVSVSDSARSSRSTVIRGIGWALLPVFLAAYWLSTSRPWPLVSDALVALVAYGSPVLITVVLCILCARRSHGLERRFWYLLATANAALFISEVALAVWLIFIDPLGPPRIAIPFQPLHLIAAIAFLGVLASMTQVSSASLTAKVRYGTDALVIAAVLYVLSLQFYARPVMEPSADATWEILVGACYPVVAVLMLIGVVFNVAGFKTSKWRSWETLVVLAMAVYLGGVALWPTWFASAVPSSRSETRDVLDLLQLTGHYTLLMATIYRLTEGSEWFPRPLPPLALGRRRWIAMVFPLAALLASAIAAVAAYNARNEGSWAVIYGVVASLLMGLVLLRSSLLALEHSTLFHRSITDPLTGLYNHRYFHDLLREELDAARSFGEALSLVMIDLDDFGDYNSLYGHQEGDRLLASTAEKLVEMSERTHPVSRIGGDEFALLMPRTQALEAHLFAQRLVDHLGIEIGEVPGKVTISAGVATFPDDAMDTGTLFRHADCAMLYAKERGKNRAAMFEEGRVPDKAGRERVEHLARQSRLSSVRALAAAVDARDPATQNHSAHVATLAVRLGSLLGLDEERLRLLQLAALMHDVGKIGIPDAILAKPGPLDPDEYLRVQDHVVLGQRILSSTDLPEILPWVRHHHERWDGSGYPDGLAGEDIPLESRILHVCDAYDAMVSDRPYRAACTVEYARTEISRNAGTQFDPNVAVLFTESIGQLIADGVDPV